MHKVRPLAHVSALVVAAVATLPAADERLSFTRPTLGAVLAEAPSDKREVLLDDESYLFVADANRLLVYGKRQRRWLWIQQVTTEHGRFGVAPPMVSVGWIDGYLINRDFAAVPLGPYSREPDRVVGLAADGLYRVDFCSWSDLESALTSLWIRTADLEAAFRGERPPIARLRRGGAAIDTKTDPSLYAVAAIDTGERLTCSIESGALQTVEYGKDPASPPRKVDVSIGAMTLRGITLGVAADSQFGRYPAKHGQGITGVMGADLFERYAVVVDYVDGTMEVMSPGAFRAPAGSQAIATDWRSRVPMVRARITFHDGRAVDARLVVDTGTVEPLVLRRSFAAAHGAVDGMRLGTLKLGKYALDDLPVTVAAPEPGAVDADGTIGSGVLRRFRVTFDRAGNRIVLQPGALFGIPYDYDASGLRIVANGREFGIGNIVEGYGSPPGIVVAGSAAEDARFHVGDVILELDGRSFAGATFAAVRAAFKVDGRPHTAIVRRYGALRTITYTTPAWVR